MGRAMACQPVQASRSCLGSRLSARILLNSSRSLQLSGPLGQYLPLPYVPSMPAAMRVSSALSLGSEGHAEHQSGVKIGAVGVQGGSPADGLTRGFRLQEEGITCRFG